MSEYTVDTSAPVTPSRPRTPYARNAARVPGSVASSVTRRSGSYSGKGMLTAELLVGFAILAIRLVGDATVSDDGTTVKANVLHPQGQFGPIPIALGLLGTFFILSFVVMKGGTAAKLAVIMGGCIILTLGVKSYPEIVKVGATFGSIGHITTPTPSGTLGDIYGNAGTGGPAPESTPIAVLGGLSGVLGNNIQNITSAITSNNTTTSLGVEGGSFLSTGQSLTQAAAGGNNPNNLNDLASNVASSNILSNIGEKAGGALNDVGHFFKGLF